MPNVLDANGLQVETRDEVDARFTAAFQRIYGADINLDPDTPDGQLKGIVVQEVVDLLDLLVQVFNSIDPDNAIGVVLDQRVAVNGIQRQGGTYTITPITVTTNRSLNLWGVDQAEFNEAGLQTDGNPVYWVQDNAGNRWFLIASQEGLSAGAHILNFRAEFPGRVLTTPNTLTVPGLIVLGVVSVNNPSTYSTLGTDEESDAALKIRRQRSTANSGQGWLESLFGTLSNLSGITAVQVYENTTGSTDADGIPSHSIWVIIAGSAAAADIADVIFRKRNAGAGMRGDQTYTIDQAGGSPITIRWDNVEPELAFIQFTLGSIDSSELPNVAAIREGLPALLTPGIWEALNITTIGALVQSIDPNAVVLSGSTAGISSGRDQRFTFIGTADSGSFVLSYNGEETSSLDYDATESEIETALQGLTGLENISVSGDIVSGTLILDLSAVDEVLALIEILDSTLMDGSSTVVIASNISTLSVRQPSTKQKQFSVSSENIIIAPRLLPEEDTVATGETVQFTFLGGYGTVKFSISQNLSGGTIDPETGLYEAGATPSVTDTIRAIDGLGNVDTAEVDVT